MTARSPRQATRAVARAGVGLLLSAPLLVMTALPAAALEDGEEPGEPLAIGMGLLLFLVVPLAVMVLTAVPIWVAANRRKARYRPAEGWNQQPVWFGGPDDPERAVSAASPDQPGRGGASAGW